MSEVNFLSRFWQGYSVVSFDIDEEKKSICFYLQPLANTVPVCSQCNQPCSRIHDCSERTIRDCDFLEYTTNLVLTVRRLDCPNCGRKVEKISWLDRYSRLTTRFTLRLEALCRILPLSHIAQLVGLHWTTIRNIDRRRLEKEVEPPDYSNVRQLVMDEFAIHKGHRYATVIADAATLKVLWVGEGRSREEIRPFFEELGEFRPNIEAVAMDMNTSFDLEVKMQCPNAEVVYDLFHVVAKYGREVVDRVRVDRANELKVDKKARKVIKSGRWLLLRNRQNLTGDQDKQLADLLEANQPLSLVYIMKEQLKEIWRAPTIWEGFKKWRQWHKQAMQSGIKALKDFAKKLKPYLRGIIASADYPLNTSCLEGINNKIKLIKRMGYGFRNHEYFFLKLRATFPGKA